MAVPLRTPISTIEGHEWHSRWWLRTTEAFYYYMPAKVLDSWCSIYGISVMIGSIYV